MTPTHATKKAKRYRYYVSASLLPGDHPQAQKGMRVPAGDIEALVLDRLRVFFSSRTDIGDALTPLDLETRAFDAALRNACTLSKRWLAKSPVEMKSLNHLCLRQSLRYSAFPFRPAVKTILPIGPGRRGRSLQLASGSRSRNGLCRRRGRFRTIH